jgi:hypothetical protein
MVHCTLCAAIVFTEVTMEGIPDRDQNTEAARCLTTLGHIVVSMLVMGLVLLIGGSIGFTLAIQHRWVAPPSLNVQLSRLQLVAHTTKLPDQLPGVPQEPMAFPSHMPDYYTVWVLTSAQQPSGQGETGIRILTLPLQ